MKWRILLCSDSSPEAEAGETAVRGLGILEVSSVVVLGVAEPGHNTSAIEASAQRLVDRMAGSGAAAEARIRRGHAAEEILVEAEAASYDLVVVGARGRRGLTRFRLGSTASRLAHHLPTSLLAVRHPPQRFERLLTCISGEGVGAESLRLAGELGSAAGAGVTLLHVMSQVALSWESPVEDLADSAETAIARESPEGLLLRRGLDAVRDVAPGVAVAPRLRHGTVVDEVLDEVRDGSHQLLVIGAHRPIVSRASLAPFLDDVANQLLTNAPCSVLIARAPGEG